MNALKKYLRKKGVIMDHEYPYMPFEVTPGVILETVTINPETAEVWYVYNITTEHLRLGRDGELGEIYNCSPNDIKF